MEVSAGEEATAGLAEFVAGTDYDDIPTEMLDRA